LAPVTVATFESAYRHMAQIGDRFDLVVVDEVHHFGVGMRDEALEMSTAREAPAPLRCVVSATACTGNGEADSPRLGKMSTDNCSAGCFLHLLAGPVFRNSPIFNRAWPPALARRLNYVAHRQASAMPPPVRERRWKRVGRAERRPNWPAAKR
jgi:hypothetical protein